MAFDGITVAALTAEIRKELLGGRIYKIAQPEKDELLLTIKNNGAQYRLLLSADASLPLVYLTQENKKSPMNAPNFCMLLRKHLQNAKIVEISQPGLERIIDFRLEHLNEMGDLCEKVLTIELMGKHSNLIFRDQDKIIDSIKHVSGMLSSVREVLPGREYFVPETQHKHNPLLIPGKKEEFEQLLGEKSQQTSVFLYGSYTGISPIAAQEICFLSGVDADKPTSALSEKEQGLLYDSFAALIEQVKNEAFEPVIFYQNGEPKEFSAVFLHIFDSLEYKKYDSISAVLETYYAEKSLHTRIRQKSVDLRKIVTTAVERSARKLDLQMKQLKDTEKREKLKIYGELLHTYGYEAAPGDKSLTVVNYYDGEEMTIPLDPDLTPLENAKKYFDKYSKLKRTYEALTSLTEETGAELDYLKSVLVSLDLARDENDLNQIKDELTGSGYIRRKSGVKKVKLVSRPLHYISSDGFDIYVGKNNYQNEEVTFQLAEGGDWWFHAKGMPGSHVIVKCKGQELPDRTFEEAGKLAAHYSAGGNQDKVEVDYIQKKHVKKPGGGKPGFVVYYTNYSMMIDTDISEISQEV